MNGGMKRPLMIIGARQIGKTCLIEEFCKDNFENYLYFNLEKDKNIADIFGKTFNPKEIIKNIEVRIEHSIDVSNTVLF